ncbi:MAG: hypothetical protein ACREQY_05465 [Candidatus Binatia bacterium]
MRNGARMLGAIGAVCLLTLAAGASAQAAHEPANKTAVSASSVEVAGPTEEVEILQATVRTSSPADLWLAVTLECSLVTDVTTMGNDDQMAQAGIDVWIEIDGNRVFVSTDDPEGGEVTFCNRMYRRQTEMFDDEDATIRTFFSTKSAHGFNWTSFNVGSGVHDIRVKAALDEEASQNATAEAVIGNRTLVVEPIKAANDEEPAPSDPTPTPEPGGESLIPGVL